MNLRKVWRVAKVTGQIIGGIASLIATLTTFAPTAREVWKALRASFAKYLDPLAPYSWVAKYIFLGLTIYFAITLYNKWKHLHSFISIVENRLTLDILDREGRNAALREMTHIRADVDNIEAYRHQLWADGAHTWPAISLQGYHYEISREPRIEGGNHIYELFFLPPLAKGTKVWQRFECAFTDTFTDAKEYFQHDVLYPERKLLFEILFPLDRTPRSASAKHLKGHLVRGEGPLQITTDKGRPKVSWTVARPKLGESYRIDWEW